MILNSQVITNNSQISCDFPKQTPLNPKFDACTERALRLLILLRVMGDTRGASIGVAPIEKLLIEGFLVEGLLTNDGESSWCSSNVDGAVENTMC